MAFKLDFLERVIMNNYKDLKEKSDLINKLEYIESSTLKEKYKPKIIDENNTNNNLKEAWKLLEKTKNTTLDKLSGFRGGNGLGIRGSVNDTDIKKSLLGVCGLDKSEDKKEGGKETDNITRMLGKNSTVKNPNMSKLNNLRSGLNTSQIASKAKLNTMLGIKKETENTEEVNSAFQRINELKKGGTQGNKLIQEIKHSTETVSFDVLSKKLDKKNEIENVNDKTITKTDNESTHQNENDSKIETNKPDNEKDVDKVTNKLKYLNIKDSIDNDTKENSEKINENETNKTSEQGKLLDECAFRKISNKNSIKLMKKRTMNLEK